MKLFSRTLGKHALIAAISCAFGWGAVAFAETRPLKELASTISFRGTDILIPAPVGFADAGRRFPDAARLAESLASTSQRFYFVFASRDEIRHAHTAEGLAFDKFFIVTAPRKNDEREITDPEFDTTRAGLRKKLPTLSHQELISAQKHFNDMLQQERHDISMKVDSIQSLGIVLDTPNAIGFAQTMRNTFFVRRTDVADPIVNVTIVAKLRRHVVLLYCYRTYKGPEDIAELIKVAKIWTKRVVEANT